MKGVPKELEEAAGLDGCNIVQLYTRIVMPMLKPGIVVVAIWTFLTCWNEFFLALCTMTKATTKTLPLIAQQYKGVYNSQPGILFAILIIITIPMVIFYCVVQKQFVKGIVLPCIIWGVPCLLVAVETHLSGAILIASIGIVMMIAGGCRLVFLAVPAAGAGVLGTILAFSVPYMKARIDTWLNPETDLLGDGWQVYQSLTTIGSGGLFGFGYGKSRQKYLYMSEPQNDFIFSIVCEELGWIGAVFVIALFAFFIWRGIYIAMHAPNTFSSLMVVGIISKTAVQVIFNIAVVTGSVPVTGVPLPFFSFGGTALTVLLAEIGLVLYISRFATVEKGSEPTEDDNKKNLTAPTSDETATAEEGNI